jgi:hypothetical protein
VPGLVPAIGQAESYVGRTFDAKTRGNPATKEAFEIDSDSDAGRRLAKLCRRDACLWPADKATAEACGVEFVELEFRDGVWAPKLVSARIAGKAEKAAVSNSEVG